MSGLLERAFQLKKRIHLNRQQYTDTQLIDDESGISVEERAKILSQIDEIVAETKIDIKADTFHFKPQKSSAKLPLLINLFAVLIALGGAFGLFRIFNRQEQIIVTDTKPVVTAESKLIEVMKQEAEQQLGEKDREIENIKGSLSKIAEEKAALQSGLNEEIRRREAEYRSELEKTLSEERAKLTGQGVTTEEIESRLASIQDEKQKEYSARIENLKSRAEQELAAKEAEYQKNLAAAQQERADLEQSLQERESQLRQQYEQKTSTLESEKTQMATELKQFQDQKMREKLISDQINSYYAKINNAVKQGQYRQAQDAVTSLETYLDDPSIGALPSLQSRKKADLLVIDSLRSLLQTEMIKQSERDKILNEAKSLLDSVNAFASKGDQLFDQGNVAEAEAEYIRGIETIPSLKNAYTNIQGIEGNRREKMLEEINNTIGEGNTRFLSRDYTGAVEMYRKALISLGLETARAEEFLNSTEKIGYQLRAPEELAAKDRQIASLRADLNDIRQKKERFTENLGRLTASLSSTATGGASDSAAAGGGSGDSASIVSLLGTKLTLKQLLDSVPVRKQYPTLYEDMEAYLEALSTEKRQEGELSALRDAASLLKTDEKGNPVSSAIAAVWKKYDTPDRRRALEQFLENLIALYQE